MDSRGGQLEIAGVVVGSWRGREGPSPQVMSMSRRSVQLSGRATDSLSKSFEARLLSVLTLISVSVSTHVLPQ